ncbi:MAG: hypothetical protein IT578_01145 [Verrucomicrobiae bacterium]|nr:hypothetical protein [Verrucomicrobiae bacterium]
MKTFFVAIFGFTLSMASAQQKIPDALKPWEDWATWDAPHRGCPTAYNDPNRWFCACPSELSLQVDAKGGRFALAATAFHRAWFALPGDADLWPLNVKSDGQPIAVVEKNGRPSVQLEPGAHRLSGEYRWAEMPRKVRVPADCGIVALSVEGKAVVSSSWDGEGFLWLKRAVVEESNRDFLGVKVYRLLEDGIPMWLHTILELSVSGKSREVELGNPLPEGWRLASVESPIPIAVDELGNAKAQVRAGQWLVRLRAFRTEPSAELKLQSGARPAADRELVAFKADPEFRLIELRNAPPVDASQTTFPREWRQFPVYQWDLRTPIALVEKMRGSGLQSPKSLANTRELWLDERGGGYTYRDRLSGRMQSLWRLDAPLPLHLGSVKADGEGLLLTRNPKTGTTGVEVRTRNLQLEAVGVSDSVRKIPATGWNADMDTLALTLNLPPGWRLLALFGAEHVEGDWLTSWTLLDLFLLLVFSLAVYRLWGVRAGLLAFLAFGLTYHEAGSPRSTWLFLLAPLALLRVVPEGKMRKVLVGWKYLALVAFVFVLVPFAYRQIQSVIYPQLESVGGGRLLSGFARGRVATMGMEEGSASSGRASVSDEVAPAALPEAGPSSRERLSKRRSAPSLYAASPMHQRTRGDTEAGNLKQEAQAKIQTGPGIPDWHWRAISCHWNGPVAASQKITPVLLPPFARRLVVLAGLGLIFALLARLLEFRRMPRPKAPLRSSAAAGLVAFGLAFGAANASAQGFPDAQTLETLKQRLLKPADSYPHCADLSSVSLTVSDDRLTYEARVDAAIQTALPLPGRFPAWSPLRVEMDGKPETAVRRQDGYLWIVVPAGVHRVKVEGLLSGARDWEWNFLLKPRVLTIEAPGWNVTGLRKDGAPEAQVFFSRKQAGGDRQDAAYDRREFHALVVVDRTLEIGLTWKVRTRVTRLAAPGKAVAFQVPLLAGEQVLTANLSIRDNAAEVRLAANQREFTWDSELVPAAALALPAAKTDLWVERWRLVSSPVWNVTFSGLAPVMEAQEERLVPVWHPWPGETASLTIARPEAVHGPTMTLHRVRHEVNLGRRSRTASLHLTLQCSIGEDLVLQLDPAAEITSIQRGGTKIPMRREGEKLIVPVQPGMQELDLAWKEAKALGAWAFATRIGIPIEGANVATILSPPGDRWILWTHGPLRGPAVRFWSVLAGALVAAWALGRLPHSPLTRLQWALLLVGLTQVHLAGALVVVGWFFLLARRGAPTDARAPAWRFNLFQVFLAATTACALIILVATVCQGLLGNPEMFILGNGSTPHALNWYAAKASGALPQPGMLSVSVWFYRILMLLWALWLAHSLIRWLIWGWKQFIAGGAWRTRMKPSAPPPMPPKTA